jgi:hypothetical protein
LNIFPFQRVFYLMQALCLNNAAQYVSCTFVITGRSQRVHFAHTVYIHSYYLRHTLFQLSLGYFLCCLFGSLCLTVSVCLSVCISFSLKQTIFYHILIFSFCFYVEQFLLIRGNFV